MSQPPVVIGIGEVLWDIFPDYQRPGGAPANVAYHAGIFGNQGVIASRVGKDRLGDDLRQFFMGKQIDTQYLQVCDRYLTGVVNVEMVGDDAKYLFKSPVAWDFLKLQDAWLHLAKKADAVCFGTLAQRSQKSRQTIHDFLNSVPPDCLKILDLNLREPFYDDDIIETSIRKADILKLNESEFNLLGNMFSTENLQRWLFENYNINIICLTKGKEGSELITRNSHFIEPRYKIDTGKGDSVGVGDAFTAALTHQILRDKPLDEALKSANRYAAHIAAKTGAMPDVPELVTQSVLND
ncbi:MAG: carbohydrate kinase [Balneolales bacterium]